MGKRGKCLTIECKNKILDELDKGVAVTALAVKYSIAKSTICALKKKKIAIRQSTINAVGGLGKRKTLQSSHFVEMERKLYKWFLKQRDKHLPISGEILKMKAKELYSITYGNDKFTASDGWLQRFKKRHGIRLLKIVGEKLSSRPELVDPFIKYLKETIEKFDLTPNQLYNADETGLFWKLLPDKTYVSHHEKMAPGRKSEKQRLTFLVCTNATGLHKVKPLIIGRAKNPRSLKNHNFESIDYTHSKNAWMTGPLFKQWFHTAFVPQVKKFLKNQNLPQKALLLIDNAPSHPTEKELRTEDGAIFTMFLPPNVTCLIQPMDQNVIRITKLLYRKKLLSSIAAKNPENIVEAMKDITLRDVFTNLSSAWNDLSPSMITQCWRNILNDASKLDDEDLLPLSILKERLIEVKAVTTSARDVILELLNKTDTTEAVTDSDILKWNDDVAIMSGVESDSDANEEDTLIQPEPQHSISTSTAIESIDNVIAWASLNGDIDASGIATLHKIREKAVHIKHQEKLKQQKITDFFST